jgi:hypothetical protein
LELDLNIVVAFCFQDINKLEGILVSEKKMLAHKRLEIPVW